MQDSRLFALLFATGLIGLILLLGGRPSTTRSGGTERAGYRGPAIQNNGGLLR